MPPSDEFASYVHYLEFSLSKVDSIEKFLLKTMDYKNVREFEVTEVPRISTAIESTFNSKTSRYTCKKLYYGSMSEP